MPAILVTNLDCTFHCRGILELTTAIDSEISNVYSEGFVQISSRGGISRPNQAGKSAPTTQANTAADAAARKGGAEARGRGRIRDPVSARRDRPVPPVNRDAARAQHHRQWDAPDPVPAGRHRDRPVPSRRA
eukprot:scaffold59858_cov47-Prasinocladus_malaysianus.AAC.2